MIWDIPLIKQNKCDPLFAGHNLTRIVHLIHGHKVLEKSNHENRKYHIFLHSGKHSIYKCSIFPGLSKTKSSKNKLTGSATSL